MQYTFRAARRLFRFFGFAAQTAFGTTEVDLNLPALSPGVANPMEGNLADLTEIFGQVRCDTAGKLEIYQGFRLPDGTQVWSTKTEIAVAASTFATGNFTVDGDGSIITPIAVVGEIMKVGFKTNSGTTKNFQINLLGR